MNLPDDFPIKTMVFHGINIIKVDSWWALQPSANVCWAGTSNKPSLYVSVCRGAETLGAIIRQRKGSATGPKRRTE